LNIKSQKKFLELRGQIAKKGLNVAKLAKMIGVTGTCLYQKMAGRTEFKLNEIRQISEILDCDYNFFK